MKFFVCRMSTRKATAVCRTTSHSHQMAPPKCAAVRTTSGWCRENVQIKCYYTRHPDSASLSRAVSITHFTFHFSCLKGLNRLMTVLASSFYCLLCCNLHFIPFTFKLYSHHISAYTSRSHIS